MWVPPAPAQCVGLRQRPCFKPEQQNSESLLPPPTSLQHFQAEQETKQFPTSHMETILCRGTHRLPSNQENWNPGQRVWEKCWLSGIESLWQKNLQRLVIMSEEWYLTEEVNAQALENGTVTGRLWICHLNSLRLSHLHNCIVELNCINGFK